MSKFKVLEGSWKGHVGEFVSEVREKVVEVETKLDAEGKPQGFGKEVEKVVGVVLRMAGSRTVEFAPERVDMVVEPAVEPKASE